jgi:branched-subunit amino acid aminotransferase/4-amino-4-deoxychorismate lyase
MGVAEPATAIAWIDGRWGAPADLGIRLDDRGLLLGDGLFETVLVEGGRPQLLAAHLERWRSSAALLGMEPPPDRSVLEPLIAAAVARAGLTVPASPTASPTTSPPAGALRLNWSRGTPVAGSAQASRGIGLPAAGTPPLRHRFWLQLTPALPSFTPLSAILSRQERRNAHSLLSRCKTFAYGQAIQARREARRAGADDALLLNGEGELCCGTTANLLLLRQGRWLTPPLASGCLPGVMRRRALQLGLVVERQLMPADLDQAEAVLLLNSLGCRPLAALGGRLLPAWTQAETLFRRLLEASAPAGPAPQSGGGPGQDVPS